MDWLKDILPKLAGLLKLQDPDSIKLELVDLLRDYPDFRYDFYFYIVLHSLVNP